MHACVFVCVVVVGVVVVFAVPMHDILPAYVYKYIRAQRIMCWTVCTIKPLDPSSTSPTYIRLTPWYMCILTVVPVWYSSMFVYSIAHTVELLELLVSVWKVCTRHVVYSARLLHGGIQLIISTNTIYFRCCMYTVHILYTCCICVCLCVCAWLVFGVLFH